RRASVTDDVDRVAARPGGGQNGVERRLRSLRQGGETAVVVAEAVGGEHTGAAAVGENGEPVAEEARVARQDLGGAEEVVELAHPEHAGTPEGRLVGGIRAGQRAGVRKRRLGAGGAAPGL